jgi:putative SOS response-associated peptidase YedK
MRRPGYVEGMCYSARIRPNLQETATEFRSTLDAESFEALFRMRLKEPETKVPVGIDRYFLHAKAPAEARLAKLIREYHADEKERRKAEIKETERELAELGAGKPTAAARKKIEVRERRLAKLEAKLAHGLDDISPLDDRVYPQYYAPVIAEGKHGRKLVPMRYRVRRPDGGEVPSQYNVFNARFDSLESARTWTPLFGRTHAIFPFTLFYEWVERDGKKTEIYFSPEDRSLMWAASLYSVAKGAHGPLLSFAMVTDDPPPEVAAAGHDRCPIFLRQDQLDGWLHPAGKSLENLKGLLQLKEKAFYINGLAA